MYITQLLQVSRQIIQLFILNYLCGGLKHKRQAKKSIKSYQNQTFNKMNNKPEALSPHEDGFGGLVVSKLATGTRIRWFKHGRSRWIFRASGKSSVCLPSEGK